MPDNLSLAGRPLFRVGYGLGPLTHRPDAAARHDEAVALLTTALDSGVQFYDTAQFYADGLANRLLADAFEGRRDEVFYATKVGAKPVAGMPPMVLAQHPDDLREAVEANLRTLRTDHLDLVYLRRADMAPGLISLPDQVVDLDAQLAVLADLRDAGTIGAIGLSHVRPDQVEQALPVGLAAVSNIYSMLTRGDEELFRRCAEEGVAWAPYFPLGGGGGYIQLPRVTAHPEVIAVAEELGVTTTQVGLAWLLHHGRHTLTISGTTSPAHLAENVAAAAVELPVGVLARLDALA